MGYFLADQNQVVGFYESGTCGEKSGNAFWLGQVQEVTASDDRTVISTRYLGTDDRNIQTHIETGKDYGGTFRYFPQDWRMLFFAMGSVYDNSNVHKISEVNTDNYSAFTGDLLTSFSLEMAEKSNLPAGSGKNVVRTTYGCKVNNFTITGRQGELVECEVNYIGKSGLYSSGNDSAVTASTVKPYISSNACVQIPSGVGINEMTDFTFTLNNNLQRRRYLDSSGVTVDTVLPTARDYNLTVVSDTYTDRMGSIYDKYFIGGSEFNGMLNLVNANTGSLFISLSGCTITAMDDPKTQEGINAYTLTIRPKNAFALARDSTANYGAW